MPAYESTAAAPRVAGVLLAGTAAREVTQHGLEIWTALVLVGGPLRNRGQSCVLTGLEGFDSEDVSTASTTGHQSRSPASL